MVEGCERAGPSLAGAHRLDAQRDEGAANAVGGRLAQPVGEAQVDAQDRTSGQDPGLDHARVVIHRLDDALFEVG
jgi:hypothetical protein